MSIESTRVTKIEHDLETHPERMAKVKPDFAPTIKMLSEEEERIKEELYKENPEMRPTPPTKILKCRFLNYSMK